MGRYLQTKHRRLVFPLAGAFLVIPGLVVFGAGVWELYLNWEATEEPVPITLAELISRGPGGNTNLIVTDYQAERPVSAIVDQKHKTLQLVIPLVPVAPPDQDAESAPPRPRLALFVNETHDPHQTFLLVKGKTKIHCTVMNRVEWLGYSVKVQLSSLYPGEPLDKAVILRENRYPGRTVIFGLLIFGEVAAAVAFLSFRHFLREYQAQKSPTYDVDEALKRNKGRPKDLVLAEDKILFELRSYLLSQGQDAEVWTVAVSLLRNHWNQLNNRYLDKGADHLQVSDLLEKARREAGMSF